MSTRFVIVCPARTGSTMLSRGLQAHSQVCGHGEIYGVGAPINLLGLAAGDASHPMQRAMTTVRDKDPVAFLHEVAFEAGDRKAVGFKFKYEELALRRWRKVRRAVVRDPAIKVIMLWRENLLERYLSQQFALTVAGRFGITSEAARPTEVAIELDPAALLADIEAKQAQRKELAAELGRHPMLQLTYEELAGSWATAMAAVHQFLEVDAQEHDPVTVKMRTRTTREGIANFDEVAGALRQRGYGRFLEGE